jgi:hypothetical protein
MAQPINIAPASAFSAIFCGREKMPPPIIDRGYRLMPGGNLFMPYRNKNGSLITNT